MDGLSLSGLVPTDRFATLRSEIESRSAAEIEVDHGGSPSNSDIDGREPESVASSLRVDSLSYRHSERTTLYIRTQEGDVVRLNFRSRESVKMEASRVEAGDTVETELSLSIRSRSKLSVRVQGDLNEDELAAIQSAIEQAGALAEEFFAGDLAAAFDGAAALDVDGSQLARVSLKMKTSEKLTYTSYGASRGSVPASVIAPDTHILQAAQAGAPVRLDALRQTDTIPTQSDSPNISAAAGAIGGVEQVEESESESLPSASSDVSSVSASALDQVRDFLSRLTDMADHHNSDRGRASHRDKSSNREKFTSSIDLSLKLRIFQSTLLVLAEAAPDEVPALPELVPETIEELVAQSQPPLDQVA